jgi:mono/diheme cytochrome c family protein
MIWPAMRLKTAFKLPALLAIVVPGLLALTAVTTLADSSPSPSTALPGDPAHGATLYAANCTSCHGGSLEGGIGAVLNPIDKMPGVPNSLDPTFLIDIITNGRIAKAGDPRSANMPAKGGATTLADQDIKDLAAFIIAQNLIPPGTRPYSPGDLAKSTIAWVTIGTLAMLVLTYLLSRYNMRWIAFKSRRNA